jgi:hyperosmotically inducible protein
MNIKTKIMVYVFGLTIAYFLTSCEEPGPAEKTGKQIDQAVEETQTSMEKAGEDIKEAVKKTGEKVEEAGKQMQKE